MDAPKGKHIFGTVKVGEKGQIVIPKEAREIFSIHPGESLVMLGDEASGLALMKRDVFMASVADAIFHKETVEIAQTNIDDEE
jgi:AbrB family looped-hinge helix DNA binding protein